MNSKIVVEDYEFRISSGTPVQFQGKHSRRILNGIDLSFMTSAPEGEKKLESLFSRTVTVNDPFCERVYQATFRQQSQSYTEGRPERHYVVNIRELDEPPTFGEIEIDGKRYTVLKYKETEHENDSIGMHAVIKLSADEFVAFHSSDKPAAEIKRIGVDDDAMAVRYGGAMYWSQHMEGDVKYYKQIVRFFPTSLSSTDFNLTSYSDFAASVTLLLQTVFRIEALIGELHKSGAIDQEKRDFLLGPASAFLDLTRRREVVRELSRQEDVEGGTFL